MSPRDFRSMPLDERTTGAGRGRTSVRDEKPMRAPHGAGGPPRCADRLPIGEGVAAIDRPGLQPGAEPAGAVVRRTVRERLRRDAPARRLLEPVVADRRRGAKALVHIAGVTRL